MINERADNHIRVNFTAALILATVKALAVSLIAAIGVFVVLTVLSYISPKAQAAQNLTKMDMTSHDQVISRLEMGLDGLEAKDPAKPGVLLRLADLYADRARLKAMDEVEKSCDNCNGAKDDRIKAIKTYQNALPIIAKDQQGSVVLQVAHLLKLNGEINASQNLYLQIIKAKKGTYSSAVLGMGYSALGEIQFRGGSFKQALDYFEKAKRHDLRNRAFIEYRTGWCQLNLGQEKKATKTLIRLLSNPALLATQTTDGKQIDPTFADDVSGDLAIFLARGKVGSSDISLLRRLSSDKVRHNNLKTLAEEADRQGKKNQALIVWAAYVDEGQVSHMDKLEVQVRVAQIFYDLNKQNLAANAFEKALAFWKKGGCTEPTTCEELKSRLKKFVTSWNKAQKDEPSMNVFRSYMAYLSVFSEDAEMYHWAAIVGSQNKRYQQAADLFHSAAILAAAKLKSEPKNKIMKNIFEGSLLAEIEMAEATKNISRREQAYNFYLQMNPTGERAFDVRYQRAHLYNESKNLTIAYAEFNWLARQPGKSNADLKVKSADLALDILVAMKNDQELLSRSLEYAKMFPVRKAEYVKISRTASLNIVAQKANDPTAALTILLATNMQGASTKEQIAYSKNMILLAQKTQQLDVIRTSAYDLLRIKGLTEDDREYAMEQLVWVSELQLKFDESYRLTQKMNLPRLNQADRLLRLALLAELSGNSPQAHYEKYLRISKDRRANNLVRVTLIKKANYSWREINKHLSQLKASPDLLAPLVLEAYAINSNNAQASQILKTTRIGKFPAGATLARHLSLKDLWKFDREIRSHRLQAYNDVVLRKTLKERMKLIGKSEANAKWALKRQDWSLQMLALSQLSRENDRLYKDILALPVPAKLKGEDRTRYQTLLNEQATPYATRADQIKKETDAMWSSDSLQNFEAAYNSASLDLRKLYRSEIAPLSLNAPYSAKNRLDNLLNTPYRRPSRQDLMVARRELQNSPFDEGKIQHLRDLENKSGEYSMVAYLDARLNEMKKRKSL